MSQQSRSCPLCGSDRVSILASVRAEVIVHSSQYYDEGAYERLGVDKDSQFGISKCNECDFVFSAQVPSAEFLDKLYDGGSSLEESVAIFARPARAAYAFKCLSLVLSEIAKRVAVDARGVSERRIRILDVGCAFGVGSLGLARKYYPYEVTGIEISSATRSYLADQGMQAYASLEDVPEGLCFDGIILNDVLEHVADPLGLLQAIKRLSAEQAVLWINVPNFIDWRLEQIVSQISSGDMCVPKDMNPWEHLSYFSPRTLNLMMKRAGFYRAKPSVREYPVICDSVFGMPRKVLRYARDLWVNYARSFDSGHVTSGIFVRISGDPRDYAVRPNHIDSE